MFWKKKKPLELIELIKGGFKIIVGSKSTLIKWNSIEKLIGYKVDQLTIDEICLQIEFNNEIEIVTEEYNGWREFINELLSQFPMINKKWEGIIAKPAFERNETELFNKNGTEFKCSECGETHENWPALAYNSPTSYHNLSETEKEKIGKIDADFCVIEYQDQTDRFIRVVLNQKVINYFDTLEYGLWVSLSEKSFANYSENYNNKNHETEYFGWLNSHLPNYDNTKSIPMNVITKKGNTRPEIFPHKDFEHQFVKDYYNGITKNEAEKRIHEMIKNVG